MGLHDVVQVQGRQTVEATVDVHENEWASLYKETDNNRENNYVQQEIDM